MTDEAVDRSGFVRDHYGKLSMSRTLLLTLTIAYLAALFLDAAERLTIPETGWAYMTTTWTLSAAWAGGPPVLSAFSSIIPGIVQSISQARANRRKDGDA